MNKKTKLCYRLMLSRLLSVVLFGMPAVAFFMNGNNAIDVRAEESSTEEEEEGSTEKSAAEQEIEEGPAGQTESGTEKYPDTTKPTLNAAVSDGLLTVQVHDTDSGAKSVYVNGYEFTDLTNGTLNIRLQQFDAGYEYFTISAMDNAGNMSEVYKTKNPYYKDPDDESDEKPAAQLPVNAEATKPGNATAIVAEHTRTDSDENTEKEQTGQGKEFYTIRTASDKVFYLIIDRDGEEEIVYFLTEITENDLLNITSDNSDTLPKNSAAIESAIPTGEGALPNNNGEMPEDTKQTGKDTKEVENTEDTKSTEETESKEKAAEPNPVISYILMGILGAAFIGGAYYFKVIRKKKEGFIEDEDEDEEDDEEYENEDDPPEEGSGDDFFADDDREAEAAAQNKNESKGAE